MEVKQAFKVVRETLRDNEVARFLIKAERSSVVAKKLIDEGVDSEKADILADKIVDDLIDFEIERIS